VEPIAYLALEIKQRELDSRLLIAAHLLKAGVPVVFGQQWSIFANAAALPPGVALFKTVNRIQAKNMAYLRACGHLVAATDEEALICTEEACFFEVFDDIAGDNCDYFFAQNETQKSAVAGRFPGLRGKIDVVGNSRIDLLSPSGRRSFKDEADAYRREHGKYILFNSNYGQVNSIWESIEKVVHIAANAGIFDRANPESVQKYHAKLEWERRNMQELVHFLQWTLANVPDYKIVMRPHPGERVQFWEENFGKFPNFLLIPRSNPHPWLLGAELVVHTACTTGLEAALLDRPTINLTPVPHPDFDYVTNWVNPTFERWDLAAPAMMQFLKTGTGPIHDIKESARPALDRFLPNHDDGSASKAIADGIVRLLASRGVAPRGGYQLSCREGTSFGSIKRSDTMKDKFTLSMDELVDRMQRVSAAMDVHLGVSASDLDDSIFLIMP